MSNLFETVKEILEEDKRFLSTDGTIMRNAVYEAAMKMDPALIKALLKNEETREHFFTDVDGIAVFDKVGFIVRSLLRMNRTNIQGNMTTISIILSGYVRSSSTIAGMSRVI